jgi:hypothetical protein
MVCCGSDKKSGTGSPWAGKTYMVNIPNTRWKKPQGEAGKEFGHFVPKFLLKIDNASSGVDVVLGSGDETGKQDACTPTTLMHATSPETQIGPADGRLHVSNGQGSAIVAPVYNMTFTDILTDTPDAGGLKGQFNALLDARDALELIYMLDDPTPDSVCSFLGDNFNSPCVACPSTDPNGTQAYCIQMNAVGLAAVPFSGATVQTIENEDIAASCESHAETDAGT